jgi:hypothetical protein
MMIRLKQLLTEISMTGLTPYATSFTWRLFSNSHMYDTKVDIDGTTLNMTMLRDDPYSETAAWTFSFFLPYKHDAGRFTFNASDSDAPADISYLRIMLTCAYAIRDFADTYNADQIDVSGHDSGYGKSAQKTRIYHELLMANKHMFTDFKIQKSFTGDLFLIRNQQVDATGIQDTP